MDWLAAALLGAWLAGAATAQVVQPTNFLARARAALEAGRVDLAEAYARRATEINDRNADAFLLLGMLLDDRGDRDGAVRALARAATLEPENPIAQERLIRLLRGGYPSGIDEELLRSLPGETRWGELLLCDPRLELKAPAARRWATVQAPADPQAPPARDPKYGRGYARVCYAYALQERPTRWHRVGLVRYQTEKDAPLARRVAALLAQLFWVRREYWSITPDFPRPLEPAVWLARDGRAGGEEWRGQIYLYEVGRERSPEEWTRQVIHEYGHVALPGAPIYTDPEPKANGYLGERLLAKWLRDNGATVWDGQVDLERYVSRRVTPLRERFLAAGPRSSLRYQRDQTGMEHFIGMVLAWEAAHGPRLLRAAFDRAGGEGAESFLIGCQEVLEALDPPHFELAADALLPAAAPERSAAWVFLPAGRWSVELEGASAPVVAWWDRRRLQPEGGGSRAIFTLRQNQGAWHRLELASGTTGLKRVTFVRAVGG